MTDPSLGFAHRFVPATAPGLPPLLLLHGTGGDENDLLPLGRTLLPGAALLSPRGPVLENGMPRFFRRLAEGVFDEADIRPRFRGVTISGRSASPSPDTPGSVSGTRSADAARRERGLGPSIPKGWQHRGVDRI